jgi:hypothetical protein
MDIKTAPNQHPQARKTIARSRYLRVSVKGNVGVIGSQRIARCAPNIKAERLSEMVMNMTANRAIRL